VISKEYFISESTADDSDKNKSYTPANIFDTLSHDSKQSIENESQFSGSAQKRI